MKNKKWLLVLIILLPSLMWVLLETSTINSHKLYYYGPKKAIAKNDTLYYRAPDKHFKLISAYTPTLSPFSIDSADFPLYGIMFVKDAYSNDSYRIAGLWEYLNYKKENIEHIPLFVVTELKDSVSQVATNLKKFSEYKNVRFLGLEQPKFDSINRAFFLEKPIHIDYSFFTLIDANRNIRGYYDARYVAEVKRMIGEYKHLRLKEEKQKLIKDNEIKTNS
ncbi:MAG: hypothetical protein K0S32_2640 [Bacteroidetes bacterium]|jgi:hypothetical protein|nr:hypothetical protein [Bacteroidota bacterium]